MFSSRVPANRDPNRIARALSAAASAGRRLIDLTVTNPTLVGIEYPEGLLQAVGSPAALRYSPQPFGLESARCAVARDYGRRGISVAPGRIVLTASTSEAYSLLFKLLCEPEGDDVLVPVPSYPLFDHLTQLDGVRARPYSLEYHGRWTLDEASVDRAWSAGVRAVLAVSPNNPTGSFLHADEFAELADRCAGRDAALIVDEVFADYPFGTAASPALPDNCLTFRLGGLSKSVGLPQIKLAWVAVSGPPALVDEALNRLELIADTYLSVSTPVQVAAESLLEGGAVIRARILERIRTNHATLGEQARQYPSVEVLNADAGWSAVLRVPARTSEEELVIDLIERDGVSVHPGFFFDFPHEAFLVISLLPECPTFAEGVRRILERAGA
jgi:aspartate/methionine/tyrosine aminotransferase